MWRMSSRALTTLAKSQNNAIGEDVIHPPLGGEVQAALIAGYHDLLKLDLQFMLLLA